jgi:hypothetical protein
MIGGLIGVFLGLSFAIVGVHAIVTKEVTVGGEGGPPETLNGRSAVAWGIFFTVVGIGTLFIAVLGIAAGP